MEAYSNTNVGISKPRQATMREEGRLAQNKRDFSRPIAAAHYTEQDYTRALSFLSVAKGKKEGGSVGRNQVVDQTPTRVNLDIGSNVPSPYYHRNSQQKAT